MKMCNLRNMIRGSVFCFGIVLFGLGITVSRLTVSAFDYSTWLTTEQTKYPAGGYWNHVGMDTDNSEGYTGSPCTLHGASGVDHVYGTGGCTCNHFGDPGAAGTADYPAVWHYSATQCMGFANKLGYDMFGTTKWSRITTASDSGYAANVRVGDIVRISNHSAFVISKTDDNKITVAECNYTSREYACLIAWGRTIDLATVTGFEYYDRAQNYDSIVGGVVAPVQTTTEASQTTTEAATSASTEQTTEKTTEKSTEEKTTETAESYTGWKLADDGEHYLYIRNNEVVKDDWVTISKKKYYLDENGYYVTGLYEIDGRNYYFDEAGVLQKKKWITIDENTYYIGNSGYALKSQWLYKGKTLVYVKSDCRVAKNELVKISGNTYYFKKNGKRSKGFKRYNGQYYYCNSYGIILKKQWITKGKKRYYMDKYGVRVSDRLIKISGSRYYFNSKGILQKNKEIEYDGSIYKADSFGRCKFVDYVEEADDTSTE